MIVGRQHDILTVSPSLFGPSTLRVPTQRRSTAASVVEPSKCATPPRFAAKPERPSIIQKRDVGHIPPKSPWLNLQKYCFGIADSGRNRGHVIDICGFDRACRRRDRAPTRSHRLGSNPEPANCRHCQSRRVRCDADRRRARTGHTSPDFRPNSHHVDVRSRTDQLFDDSSPNNDNHHADRNTGQPDNDNASTAADYDDTRADPNSRPDDTDRGGDCAFRAARRSTGVHATPAAVERHDRGRKFRRRWGRMRRRIHQYGGQLHSLPAAGTLRALRCHREM